MNEPIFEKRRTSFGSMAETYDRYRPGWPAATAAWLTGSDPDGPLSGRAALDVLDLGAGTGKLTRTLVGPGHRVTAVDPSEGMLAVLAASLPGISTRVGAGERIPLPDACIDAVTVAQAWHWMDPAAAGAECARVLRPGGVLGVGWNTRSDDVAWLRELDALISDPANQRAREIREQADNLRVPAPFGPLQSAVFTHEERLDPAGLVALASSFSYVAVRPDRDEVLSEVAGLAARNTDPDGLITVPYKTYAYRTELPT